METIDDQNLSYAIHSDERCQLYNQIIKIDWRNDNKSFARRIASQ